MDGLDGAKILPKSSAIWVGGNKLQTERRQTGGQTTDRQTDLRRHKANVATDRQTDTHTDRQTDRYCRFI